MYGLRIAYQRHRRLLPHFGAAGALFAATLFVTMPAPRLAPDPVIAAEAATPLVPAKAGTLSTLLISRPLDGTSEGLSFSPAEGTF